MASKDMFQLCKFCRTNPDEAIDTYGGQPICADCLIEVEETLYQDALAEEMYDHIQECGPLCPEHGDPRDTSIIASHEANLERWL